MVARFAFRRNLLRFSPLLMFARTSLLRLRRSSATLRTPIPDKGPDSSIIIALLALAETGRKCLKNCPSENDYAMLPDLPNVGSHASFRLRRDRIQPGPFLEEGHELGTGSTGSIENRHLDRLSSIEL